MNNKGFTLIEILGVLLLISILLLIILPTVSKVKDNSKDLVLESQYRKVMEAAYDMSLSNTTKYLNSDSYISLGELKSRGYIEGEILIDTDNNFIPDDIVVGITETNKVSKYLVKYGNYTYYIKETMNDKKPSIILTGTNITGSDGKYSSVIELGSTYIEPTYQAKDYSNNAIDNVYINIVYDKTVIPTLDTSKIAVYKLTYTAVDDSGNANSIEYKVSVTDTTAPVLILESNSLNISIGSNSDSLMSGVSCTDLSGDCKITTTGTVNYNEAGSYIITYIAQDQSGNTSTQRRTIVVS